VLLVYFMVSVMALADAANAAIEWLLLRRQNHLPALLFFSLISLQMSFKIWLNCIFLMFHVSRMKKKRISIY